MCQVSHKTASCCAARSLLLAHAVMTLFAGWHWSRWQALVYLSSSCFAKYQCLAEGDVHCNIPWQPPACSWRSDVFFLAVEVH
jgi:hypothetical protein